MEGKGKGKVVEEGEGKLVGPSKRKEKWKKVGGMLLVVGKRGGPSTPSPTWRLEFFSPRNEGNSNNPVKEFLHFNPGISARKLCASLWEVQPQLNLPPVSKKGNIGTGKGGDRRRDEEELERRHRARLVDLPSSSRPDQQPGGYTKKNLQTSPVQERRSVGRNDHALKPLSPTSHSSSTEVALYNPALVPMGSLDFKGRKGESNSRVKTSTELLKVLNKIWSLEKQQASNISILKGLKMELEHSHLQINELINDRHKNRRGMANLRKHVAEHKVCVKKREMERMQAAFRLAQEELEDERKLRMQSEGLHQKLARELSEVKSCCSLASKEVERERKARMLLEDLCNEFALEIKDYEQEVRSLRHKAEMDHIGIEKPDRLVLHISEAWLDGRKQMELAEAQNRLAEKEIISRKLSLDIKTFLQARHSAGWRKGKGLSANRTVNICSRRESFPLNEAASAPQDAGYDENSSDSDSHCFELNKNASKGHNIISTEQQNSRLLNLPGVQVQLEALMTLDKNQFPTGETDELRVENRTGVSNIATADIYKANKEGLHGINSKWPLNHPPSTNSVLRDQHRNNSMSSEGDKVHPVSDFKEDSCNHPISKGRNSPIKQWMPKLASPEFDRSDSSLKFPGDVKDNTLKAKLLEARLEDQRSRLKANKASS